MPKIDLSPNLFRVFESKGWDPEAAESLLHDLNRGEGDSLSEKIKAALYLVVQRGYPLEDVRFVLGLEECLPGPFRVSSMPAAVVQEAVIPPGSHWLMRLGRALLPESSYQGVVEEAMADLAFELATASARASRWSYLTRWSRGVWACGAAISTQSLYEIGRIIRVRFVKRV